jgi:hypothetical protein
MKLAKLIMSETSFDFAIHWWLEPNGDHVVSYGTEVRSFQGPDADVQACHAYGEFVRHGLELAGAFEK